jgi:hypothetical protein
MNIFITIYAYTDDSMGQTNVRIHENTFFQQTTKIGIHEFKWIHAIVFARRPPE